MLSTGYIDSQIKEGDNAQRSSLLGSLSSDVSWSDARQPEVRYFSSYKHASDINFVFLSFFTVIKAI